MRFLARATALLLFAVSTPALAKNTGFLDSHKGLTLGAGTYKHWIDTVNAYDPVPGLAPSGTTTSGSDAIPLYPLKAGYFLTRGNAEIETYFRYMINGSSTWSATGGQEGTGTFTFRSYGAGINAGVALVQTDGFQFKLTLNGEYVRQRLKLKFTSTSATELLSLQSTSLLAGAGLQPEFWLGDLWALSIFAGYQYGMKSNWSIAKAGAFMGQARSAGEFSDSAGAKVPARFGGFLGEITLKLHFYN
jgi:hypothetical protein